MTAYTRDCKSGTGWFLGVLLDLFWGLHKKESTHSTKGTEGTTARVPTAGREPLRSCVGEPVEQTRTYALVWSA